jgi:chorismate-pyruvate lyase
VVAAKLLGGLPDLAQLPIDELLDVREELSPYVGRFRAAIAELEGTLDDDLRVADLDAAIAEVRKLRVEPELEALQETLRENRLLPTVARAVPLTGSGVVGLAVTTLAGASSLAAASAVAVGLSAAAANEYLRRHEQETQRRKHKLFLLHLAASTSRR